MQGDPCLRKAQGVRGKVLLTSRGDSVSHTCPFSPSFPLIQNTSETSYVDSSPSSSTLPAPVIHSDHTSDSVSYQFKHLSEIGAGCGMLSLKTPTWKPRSFCCHVWVFAGLRPFCHTNCTWNCPYPTTYILISIPYSSFSQEVTTFLL